MDKRPRILIVDDDPVNYRTFKFALKDEYDILSAENGFEAISKIKEHLPDLILLDVMMPEMSGYDLCSIIKSDEAFADIPVIFLTAVDTRGGEFRGLELGGIDYLTKPVNTDLLKLRVRNHIAMKERTDQLKKQIVILERQNKELEEALAQARLTHITPVSGISLLK